MALQTASTRGSLPMPKFAGDFSGMAVGGGDGSSAECADHYPNNAKSWAIFGPFSLADAIAAEVQIKAWVYTEPNHDWLCLTVWIAKSSTVPAFPVTAASPDHLEGGLTNAWI